MRSNEELATAAQGGDQESLTELGKRMLRSIKAVAMSVAESISFREDPEDFWSAGWKGVLDCVRNWDPERGLKFTTYASGRIRGAMLDQLRSFDEASRLSRTIMRDLENGAEERWSDEQILLAEAEIKKISLNKAAESKKHCDESIEIWQMVPSREPEPRRDLEAREELWYRLRRRSLMEQAILVLYYHRGLTMKAIGAYFGLSESRICQLHRRAIQGSSGRAISHREHGLTPEDIRRFYEDGVEISPDLARLRQNQKLARAS